MYNNKIKYCIFYEKYVIPINLQNNVYKISMWIMYHFRLKAATNRHFDLFNINDFNLKVFLGPCEGDQ